MKIWENIKGRIHTTHLGVFVLGILLGWLIFGGGGKSSENLSAEHNTEDHQPGEVWICSMHPQIREDQPGYCPICGMDLVPITSDDLEADGEGAQFTVKLSNAAMKIAEVSTATIEKKAPGKEIYLPGKVMADERRISKLTARFPGRIKKLMINFTGQKVRKGQVLAKIYSPELVTAQKELFEAHKYKESNPKYYQASRQKLKLWDLTEEQINTIERSGEIEYAFDVLSPITGTVTMRHVALGDYMKEGSPLFEVTNLRHVWVIFDAYERDLPWIKPGDKIKFTLKSVPGEEFEGTVTFIDPVIDQKTRVAGVRAELDNPKDRLKPQMLASGILNARLPERGEELVVPKSAVLWTGKKAVVYVMTDDHNNLFQYREIELGAEAGDYYVVEEGLNVGEMVASNGVFKIDAAAQLQGKQSMMNPEGGRISTGHDHGNRDMGAGEQGKHSETTHPEINISNEAIEVSTAFRKQLKEVFEAYLPVKNALVETETKTASQKAATLLTAIDEVDMGLVKGDARLEWMKDLEVLKASVQTMVEERDLEKIRAVFSPLSDQLYHTLIKFGVETGGYRQYCPMAFDFKGAYWISHSDQIRNPYFGDKMLTCGEVSDTLP